MLLLIIHNYNDYLSSGQSLPDANAAAKITAYE